MPITFSRCCVAITIRNRLYGMSRPSTFLLTCSLTGAPRRYNEGHTVNRALVRQEVIETSNVVEGF